MFLWGFLFIVSDHPKPPNIEEENSEKAENIFSFWDALQNSKWTSPELFEVLFYDLLPYS